MIKYISKRQKRIRLLKIAGAVFLFFLILISLFFTRIGNNLVKQYLTDKIDKYAKGARVTFLDYGLNSFSLNIKQQENTFKLYGELFPLNAMFEGDLENISLLFPEYRGNMQLNGKIWKKDGIYNVKGTSYFAQGDLNFVLTLGKFSIYASGEDFDISKLLYMLKINNSFIKGLTDLKINGTADTYDIVLESKGEIPFFNTEFKSFTKINAKNKNNFSFASHVVADMGTVDIKGYNSNKKCECSFKAKDVDLSYLKKFLIYPLHNKVNFDGRYNSLNGIFKFKSKNFEGFYDTHLELTFKMDSDKFFNYIGIKKFFKGIVTGIVKINKNRGYFDLVSDKSVLLKTTVIDKIRHLSGINLQKEKLSKIFFKGNFDNNGVVFDALSTNNIISVNIKQGKFNYNGNYDFILFIRKRGNIYKFKITNKSVKLLYKKTYSKNSDKILVY